MEDNTRENLIQALAASMGHEDIKSTRLGDSRFNPDTGTLFCNGYVVSKNTIEEARQFFEKQSQRYANSPEKELKNMSQIYAVGAEAIKMMQNNDLGTGTSSNSSDFKVIKK
ncbi:MAG: hypothetical protein J6O71_04985 [Lachnospiraceae bacterium]|nr:hypothetical protein [Lachnospiraceae bacterium]